MAKTTSVAVVMPTLANMELVRVCLRLQVEGARAMVPGSLHLGGGGLGQLIYYI